MALAVVVASEEAAGAEKRPGAFRTISEVAEELAVPQHVLRFWEGRFAQVRPVKRAGGRRYYRPEDVDLLKGIKRLLHGQGYTIRGAQRVLKERGLRFVQAVGRGEAEPGPPSAPEHEAGVAERDLHDPMPEEAARDRSQALLHAALQELHACREALAALRSEPADDRREGWTGEASAPDADVRDAP